MFQSRLPNVQSTQFEKIQWELRDYIAELATTQEIIDAKVEHQKNFKDTLTMIKLLNKFYKGIVPVDRQTGESKVQPISYQIKQELRDARGVYTYRGKYYQNGNEISEEAYIGHASLQNCDTLKQLGMAPGLTPEIFDDTFLTQMSKRSIASYLRTMRKYVPNHQNLINTDMNDRDSLILLHPCHFEKDEVSEPIDEHGAMLACRDNLYYKRFSYHAFRTCQQMLKTRCSQTSISRALGLSRHYTRRLIKETRTIDFEL